MHYSPRKKHERIERHVFLLLFSDKLFNAFKMFRFYIYIHRRRKRRSMRASALDAFKWRAEPLKMSQALRK